MTAAASVGRRPGPAAASAESPAPLAVRVVLAAILLATALLRLRLLHVPLERDEGEYAYMGQLILRGEMPYLAAHNMKLPGVYYAYAALLSLFGESEVGVRLGLLAVNLIAIALVYRIGRRLQDPASGVVAAAVYAALSLGESVAGFSAKAEHFVVAAALGGLLVLLPRGPARSPTHILVGGLLLGLAILAKQHAVAFAAFGGLTLLVPGLGADRVGAPGRVRQVLLYAAAAALPFAGTCLAMWALGVWQPFWFWTFTYAREYATLNPLAIGLEELRRQVVFVVGPAASLWLLAAVGLAAPLWDEAARRSAAYLTALLAFSFAAICPGLRFSEHYFVMLLPVASLLAGGGVSALARAAEVTRPGAGAAVCVALPVLALAVFVAQQRHYLFTASPTAISRSLYHSNPFPEAVEIARYLREHAAPGDRLAVIGSEPEIYFHSRVPAATSYIYMYPLMEPQPFARRMQEDMIAQLEREKARFMVLVNVDQSWTRKPESSLLIQEWARRTAEEAYETVGVAEIVAGQDTVYRWGEEARDPPPRSRLWIQILERRG